MRPPRERVVPASLEVARSGTHRAQLITLAVDTPRERDRVHPAWAVLSVVEGVEFVEPDPATGRLWVFADGSVEPQSLVDALATWGCGAYVLDNQFEVPA